MRFVDKFAYFWNASDSMRFACSLRVQAAEDVTLVFAEDEHMDLPPAAHETTWLLHLLQELGATQIPATVTNVDNRAAISMVEHANHH